MVFRTLFVTERVVKLIQRCFRVNVSWWLTCLTSLPLTFSLSKEIKWECPTICGVPWLIGLVNRVEVLDIASRQYGQAAITAIAAGYPTSNASAVGQPGQ